MKKLAVFLFLSLIVSCSSKKELLRSSAFTDVRSAEFRIQSEEISGSGTLTYLGNSGVPRIVIYSPFGAKLAEISRDADSVYICDGETVSAVSLNASLQAASIISIPTLSSADLFTILSGAVPANLENCLKSDSVCGDSVEIIRKRDKIELLRFHNTAYTAEFKKIDGVRFRSANLSVDRRNYFHIVYEE